MPQLQHFHARTPSHTHTHAHFKRMTKIFIFTLNSHFASEYLVIFWMFSKKKATRAVCGHPTGFLAGLLPVRFSFVVHFFKAGSHVSLHNPSCSSGCHQRTGSCLLYRTDHPVYCLEFLLLPCSGLASPHGYLMPSAGVSTVPVSNCRPLARNPSKSILWVRCWQTLRAVRHLYPWVK